MTKPHKINGIDAIVLAQFEAARRRAQECCERKRRFADEWAARAQGVYDMEQDRFVGQLYVYKCKICRGYHLTRQEQSRPEAAVGYYFKEKAK